VIEILEDGWPQALCDDLSLAQPHPPQAKGSACSVPLSATRVGLFAIPWCGHLTGGNWVDDRSE
jgi:hypothetical protein